jgi:hypothetical protein
MKITDSRAKTSRLKDTSTETMETLRQGDAFARLAQDESLPIEQRRAYMQMAELRYRMVYVWVDEDGNVVT